MNLYEEKKLIRDKVPYTELLAGLAEEAAELAQAALKYRRAIDGTNPTPVTAVEAMAALHEEAADVMLYLSVLDMVADVSVYHEDMAKRTTEKFNRWIERLGGVTP
jgi:NTP pyrophosphatase (non-canonical NTP hydrolase)